MSPCILPSPRLLHCFALLALITALAAPVAHAAERNGDARLFLVATLENDLFAGGDSGYTNGIGLGWGYGGFDDFDGRLPGWMRALSRNLYISTMENKKRAITYGIGQQMFTPENIEARYPDPDDRPYAGLLLWRGVLYAYDDKVADRLALHLGVVGPLSLAESGQKLVHGITGSDEPRGWDEQLHNELVFRVDAQRNWQLLHRDTGRFEFDMVGMAHAGAGTLRSDAGAGMSWRIGHRLTETLPTVAATPAREVNPLAGATRNLWYVFFSASAGYVFNDITINGNTFRNSPSVSLKHEQAFISAGLAWNIGNWGILFAMQRGTDSFHTQRVNTEFGSLSLTYRYPR